MVEAVSRAFFLAPFTSIRGNLLFMGNFGGVTLDQTLAANIKRSTLKSDGIVAQIHPSAGVFAAPDRLKIWAAPGYVAAGASAPSHGLFVVNSGQMPTLASFKSADSALGSSALDISLGTVSYGNPFTAKSFAARYGTVGELDANFTVVLGNRVWNVGLQYIDSMTAFAAFTSNASQAPVIAPIPANVAAASPTFYFQVGAGPCTTPLPAGCFAANSTAGTTLGSLGSPTPLLSWGAAAGATYYVVEVYQTSGGTGSIGAPVARIRTAGTNTSVQIPPGVLNAATYVAVVWSYKETGRDLTKPYRGLPAGSLARAPAFTNPFSP
jgi:hypothetical protein